MQLSIVPWLIASATASIFQDVSVHNFKGGEVAISNALISASNGSFSLSLNGDGFSANSNENAFISIFPSNGNKNPYDDKLELSPLQMVSQDVQDGDLIVFVKQIDASVSTLNASKHEFELLIRNNIGQLRSFANGLVNDFPNLQLVLAKVKVEVNSVVRASSQIQEYRDERPYVTKILHSIGSFASAVGSLVEGLGSFVERWPILCSIIVAIISIRLHGHHYPNESIFRWPADAHLHPSQPAPDASQFRMFLVVGAFSPIVAIASKFK